MVLKKSKFGANSGNTLRRKPHGVFNQISQRSSFITKSINKHLSSNVVKKEWIDDFDLNKNSKNQTTDCVKFSLNKKNRWLLPDQLKNEVEEEMHLQKFDNDGGKEMRKKNKQNTWATSKPRVVITEKPNDGYFSAHYNYCSYFSDSQNKMTFGKSKNKIRAKIQIPRGIQNEADVIYTIQKPFSSKTWPYHIDSSKKKQLTCKKKPKKTDACRNIDKEFLDESDLIYEVLHDGDYEITTNELKPLTLEDFLSMSEIVLSNSGTVSQNTTDEQILDLVNPASSIMTKKYPKGSFITISSPVETLETVDETSRQSVKKSESENNLVKKGTVYQEFQCLLSTKEISQSNLERLFGICYREGGSYPRSFIISNKELSMTGTLAYFQIYAEIDDETSSVFAKIFCPLFEKPAIHGKVMEIAYLTRLIFGENSKILDCGFKGEQSITCRKYQAEACVINTDEIWYNGIKSYPLSTIYRGNTSNICPICCGDDIINMICLKECEHYFCAECLENYVETKISAGIFAFSCLEFNCNSDIDYVTLLGVIEGKYLSILNRKMVELSVHHDGKMEFCPNSDCSKVALVSSDKTKKTESKALTNNAVVVCSCKETWCFACKKDNHWPSSCAAYESYRKQKEKDIGVIFDKFGKLFEVSINVRTCPFCRNPVDKNGGCNHMVCFCGKEFCWNCLKGYRERDHSNCHSVKDDSIVFTSVDEKTGGGKLVETQRKAYRYSSSIQEISSLKRKLKIEKYLNEYQLVTDKQKNKLIVLKRSFDLLKECYQLMENLTVARAFSKSRHLSAKIVNFMTGLEFNVKILKQSITKSEMDIVNVGVVLKNEQFVRCYLEKLKFLVR